MIYASVQTGTGIYIFADWCTITSSEVHPTFSVRYSVHAALSLAKASRIERRNEQELRNGDSKMKLWNPLVYIIQFIRLLCGSFENLVFDLGCMVNFHISLHGPSMSIQSSTLSLRYAVGFQVAPKESTSHAGQEAWDSRRFSSLY